MNSFKKCQCYIKRIVIIDFLSHTVIIDKTGDSMQEFINGSHDGDLISQMDNDILIFNIMMLDRYKEEDKEELLSELINELDFRIRADAINLNMENYLDFVLELNNPQLFTCLCEISSDYSSDILHEKIILQNNKKHLNFFKHYLDYYKTNIGEAPYGFFNIYKKFKKTEYEKDILKQLDEYLLINPCLVSLLKEEHIINEKNAICFIQQEKIRNFYSDRNKNDVAILLEHISNDYWSIKNIENFMQNNSPMGYFLSNKLSIEHPVFHEQYYPIFLKNIHKSHDEDVFLMLPEEIKHSKKHLHHIFEKFPLLNPALISNDFRNDYCFILNTLLSNKGSFLDYFVKKTDNKEEFIKFLANVAHPFSLNDVHPRSSSKTTSKNTKYKEIEDLYEKTYPDLYLKNRKFNLSMDFTNLLISLQKYDNFIENSDNSTKTKIFEAMYRNIKTSDMGNFSDITYFFQKNNLENYYLENINHDINFFHLFCITIGQNYKSTSYNKILPLIYQQLNDIVDKKDEEYFVEEIIKYRDFRLKSKTYIPESILLDIFSVIPLNKLLKFTDEHLLKLLPDDIIVIEQVPENKNINSSKEIHYSDFISHLKTISFELDLLREIDNNNIPSKVLKF